MSKLKEIKEYIEKYDLSGKSREQEYVFKRCYLYRYLYEIEKLSLSKIGKLFNRHHATVLNSLVQFDSLQNYDEFIRINNELYSLFKLDIYARGCRSLNLTPITWQRNQYKKIVDIRIKNGLKLDTDVLKYLVDTYEV